MRRRALAFTLCATATVVVVAGALVRATYSDGAPSGFSGGFGEDSCHACHFGAPVNSDPGRVTVIGVPDQFIPGERYPLTVALTRSEIKVAGFQMTARFQKDGAQAGTLAVSPDETGRVAIEVQGRINYASQRQKGTLLVTSDTARWSVVWTAPTTSGPVAFHVAANAANGDETAAGDYIHTTVVQSTPKSVAIHVP